MQREVVQEIFARNEEKYLLTNWFSQSPSFNPGVKKILFYTSPALILTSQAEYGKMKL